MKSVFVRPVSGRLILMPERAFKPVPEAGVRVPQNAFYTRAINQGDLVVVPDAPAATPVPSVKAATTVAAHPSAPAGSI